jgi:hypothetical protein
MRSQNRGKARLLRVFLGSGILVSLAFNSEPYSIG